MRNELFKILESEFDSSGTVPHIRWMVRIRAPLFSVVKRLAF